MDDLEAFTRRLLTYRFGQIHWETQPEFRGCEQKSGCSIVSSEDDDHLLRLAVAVLKRRGQPSLASKVTKATAS